MSVVRACEFRKGRPNPGFEDKGSEVILKLHYYHSFKITNYIFSIFHGLNDAIKYHINSQMPENSNSNKQTYTFYNFFLDVSIFQVFVSVDTLIFRMYSVCRNHQLKKLFITVSHNIFRNKIP